MSDLRDMFFEECDELLESVSSGLIDIENEEGDDETVHAMFRAVHSIKGGAGAFGLTELIAFAHTFENVLDDLRSDKLTLEPNILSLLASSADHLSDLVEGARDDVPPATNGAALLADLKALTESVNGAPSEDEGADAAGPSVEFEPLTLDFGGLSEIDTTPPASGPIRIHFAPEFSLYASGHDPALLFRALGELGDMDVKVEMGDVVPLNQQEELAPTLIWNVTLTPNEGIDEEAVREVFEFVEGTCDLSISSAVLENAPELPDLPPLPEPPAPVVEPAPVSVSEAAEQPAEKPASEASKEAVKKKDKENSSKNRSIRVELDRVERLINLVGELVISEAMLRQSMSEVPRAANSSVDEAMSQLRQLSGVLQESVMAIRAQPVRNLFQRMSRIVRESAKEAGKSARLVTTGDATEVDKTVIERLVEPLTHMIRNSVDHGLESPDKRSAVGKSETGLVRLDAAHRSGRVVISLSDDGAGINREKVRQIAEEKGLVRPEEDLSETDIDNLLFKPGFSTATEVSNLSGRGVGMDVVRTAIQSLGGRITLLSTPGKGTTVRISLPLTLAVLEGMVVTVGNESLVVPTLALRETLRPGQAHIHPFCENDKVLHVDGGLVPVVDLGAALGYRRTPEEFADQSLLLIEGESGKRTALAVDGIVDQREVVIKGLEQNYQQIPGIAAATILGDGKIALIVDTDQMISGGNNSHYPTHSDASQIEAAHVQ